MDKSEPADAADPSAIRIGVSSCLLGARVRFDGGHKRNDFLVDTFGRWVEWIPVCPEMEIGLGAPRESLRLQRAAPGGETRMVAIKSGRDLTAAMHHYAHQRVAALERAGLHGYVLKKDSPSCGMERVRVYGAAGMPSRSGRGLFAEALIERFPDLPVEEEGRLSDPRLRENFIERVFAYKDLRVLLARRFTVGALIAFHSARKLQLLAHSPRAYSALGQMVAQAKAMARDELRERYQREFMAALAVLATVRRHTNVLQHMAGYLSDQLDRAGRGELAGVIDDYRRGLVPLIVPLTLLAHYVRLFDVAYLKAQSYLQPHPKELMLRNHV